MNKIKMSDQKEIYTGLYLFSAIGENTSFGGVSGRVNVPDCTKEMMLFIQDRCKHETVHIDGATNYRFSIEELQGLYEALGKILNDVRKLEVLSVQN